MMRTFDFQKTPIVDIVNEILVDATKKGASDIHFDPYVDHLLIRVRIDGILHDYAKVPQEMRDYLITRVKTVARMNITESRLPQDGAIKASLQGVELDLRVSSLPVSLGEKIVIRILDYSMSLAGLGELDFSEENYKKVLEMISVPNGIILVTGATGSGKSTTVYSILQHLNTSSTNIITVEDPIEMDIAGINQVQANSKIGLDFATALRSILRQDPNIIMIGEIRDTETARIAVRASITGHLVLSTLHTNTSLNTIERLIDMDVQKYLLSSALEGVISQKLARRLCEHCKEKRKATSYEKKIFKTVLGKDIDEIWDAEGCEHCHDGYKGRIPIHEVLKITQEIRDALGEDAEKEKFRDLVYGGSDVITLLQDGLQKVVDGKTSFEEILKLIELEDEDQISHDTSLKEAILETKAALSYQNKSRNEFTKDENIGINNNTDLIDYANIVNSDTQTSGLGNNESFTNNSTIQNIDSNNNIPISTDSIVQNVTSENVTNDAVIQNTQDNIEVLSDIN
ncbi:MAG: type II/IV secretion system protein [Bacilli bacterium]|nr:type II/IV secretion system protein [Bacilli bacterium]